MFWKEHFQYTLKPRVDIMPTLSLKQPWRIHKHMSWKSSLIHHQLYSIEWNDAQQKHVHMLWNILVFIIDM